VYINPVAYSIQGLYAATIFSKVIGKPRPKKGKNSPELLTAESSENRKLRG